MKLSILLAILALLLVPATLAYASDDPPAEDKAFEETTAEAATAEDQADEACTASTGDLFTTPVDQAVVCQTIRCPYKNSHAFCNDWCLAEGHAAGFCGGVCCICAVNQ